MIGLKFLMTFVTVIIFAAIFAFLLFALWFAVTWIIRLFITGFGVTAKDHFTWVKEHAPKRKKGKGKYRVYAMDTMNFLFETENPEIVLYSMNHPNQFIVVPPGEELKNV